MSSRFPVHASRARSILSRTSGFIARAGFTHSLNPARNCTFGCTYCYVPTLRVYGGLKPDDWQKWGRHTTYKVNAGALLKRELRPSQVIFCSPLVDPYQPAEASQQAMPAILRSLCKSPPAAFVLQTRSSLVMRDLELLTHLATLTRLRVSFSLTTDREDIRRLYEAHCEPIESRVRTLRRLTDAGVAVHCTLAPILPCDPVQLARIALESTDKDIIADPLHSREGKPHGATTRPEAIRISRNRGHAEWHTRAFQDRVLAQIRRSVEASGRRLGVGESGFRMLTS